jgi:hypothetical protein
VAPSAKPDTPLLPLPLPQLTVLTTKFDTAASVTTAPFAAAGPALLTTRV